MLGGMKVVSTNLKCDKQSDGNYLYEYSVQVYPKEEDEDLAALLRSDSHSSIGSSDYSSLNYSAFASTRATEPTRTLHSEEDCICMIEVRFVLYHHNMNGKGVFAPRLSYRLGRERVHSYPLLESDLEKTLAELCGCETEANTITIIADVTVQ
ncbi:unnamed protein product [Heligmosomoides polygyrus]|uniref:MATH domain-containing protein n=1 Tax=Heligmosomoides polygyrus TaxID=6339 RepID=A0A183GKX7_HELPZ|nr:unnamed protein product [Heligmosomoides polygyrus]